MLERWKQAVPLGRYKGGMGDSYIYIYITNVVYLRSLQSSYNYIHRHSFDTLMGPQPIPRPEGRKIDASQSQPSKKQS